MYGPTASIFSKPAVSIFSAISAAIICGALRRIRANENAGKARSPISEFFGTSSRLTICSWSNSGTIV